MVLQPSTCHCNRHLECRQRRIFTVDIDLSVARNYSFAMTEANRSAAVELELKRLEKRIDELLRDHAAAQGRESCAARSARRRSRPRSTSLLHRNEQVRTRVEAMIGRLKVDGAQRMSEREAAAP